MPSPPLRKKLMGFLWHLLEGQLGSEGCIVLFENSAVVMKTVRNKELERLNGHL
jgi:hypothetical protein